MERSYWTQPGLARSAMRRLSRRRFLATTGGGFAVLTAAACGSGSSSSTTTPAGTRGAGSLGSPQSSPAAGTPKAGGTWYGAQPTGPTSLDPLSSSSYTLSLFGSYVYSRLVRNKTGPGVDPNAFETEGDLAKTVENQDQLTYTAKLDPKATFHAPLNRPVTADDVVFSWKRSTAAAVGLYSYLDKVEAVDAGTVKFTLKSPDVEFLNADQLFFIMPQEAGSTIDPTKTMVGTGPWTFDSYVPGSRISFKRNPKWHLGPDLPYLDAVEVAIVPQYATGLSQFLGGHLDAYDVVGDDLPQVLSSGHNSQIFRGQPSLPWDYFSFSGNADAPWRDARVRRAVSMALDRDGITEAAYNVSNLRKAIPDLTTDWNNVVPNTTRPYWLDPKGQYRAKPSDPVISKDSKANFEFNIAEAKKLLAAAGHPDGFSVNGGGLHYPTARYGQDFDTISQLVGQFLKQAGMDFPLLPEDYSSTFAPKSLLGDFKGLIHVAAGGGYPLFGSYTIYYVPGAIRNNGKIDDPQLTSMINKVSSTPDADDRRVQILNLQQYTSDKMYYVPCQLGAVGSFTAFAGDTHNVLTHQTNNFDQGNTTVPYYWKGS